MIKFIHQNICKSSWQNICENNWWDISLLAFIALSAAQSSAQTQIHSTIVVIDTSNNAWHSQVRWLVGTPYLAIKASNGQNNQEDICQSRWQDICQQNS